MPKVGGSMADVSTSFVPAPPDTYLASLEKVEYKIEGARETYIMHNKLVSGEETGVENAGRTVRDMISMHKRDGTVNEIGQIQLKRYIEAAFPESEEWEADRWEEFDTDEMQGATVQLVVAIRTDPNDSEKKYNDVKRVSSVD